MSGSQGQLLEAATRVFAEKGFDRATIREIACRAGVNSALISFHFGGKERLLLEVLRLAGRAFLARAGTLPEIPGGLDPDPIPKAEAALRALVEMCIGMGREPREPGLERALLAVVAREMSLPHPGTEAALAEAIRLPASYLDQCVRALRPDLGGEARRRMTLSILCQILVPIHGHGLFSPEPCVPFTPLDLELLASHITAFSLNGVKHAPIRSTP